MRKKPVQQRSQQMVDALIDATEQVIAEKGLDHLTTVHVANRAGVSVGSLYQYFANKEALQAALLERFTRELNEVVNGLLPKLLNADLETLVRGLLLAALDFLNRKEGLYLELLRNWHRLDIQHGLHDFEQNMMDAARAYAATHAGTLTVNSLPAKTFIVTNSVVFTLLRYLSQPHPLFPRAQLVDELTTMIVSYLSNGDAKRAGKRRAGRRR